MFDDLLDIASLHNLFEPLTSFFDDIFQGPSTTFKVSNLSGFSKRQIRGILNRAGVYVWGDLQADEGYTIQFHVKQEDELKAYRALVKVGVPVIFPKLEDK